MSREVRDEIVTLRGSLPSTHATQGKVTARFELWMGPEDSVRCVRVRMGVGPTYYFTDEEFNRLFESADDSK